MQRIHSEFICNLASTNCLHSKRCRNCGKTKGNIVFDAHGFYDDSDGPACQCRNCDHAEHSDEYYTGDHPCKYCDQYMDS